MSGIKSPLFSRINFPVWILAVGASLFILPWRISNLISGGNWANPDQFAAAIQSGFLMDLENNVNTPGYGGSYLATETKFWFWFHLSKTLLALLLLALLLLYKKEISIVEVISESRIDGLLKGTLKGAVNSIALLVFLILAANIQGFIAPFSSVISFLPVQSHDLRLNRSVQKLRLELLNSESNSFASSVLRDFSNYHLTTALIFGIASLYLLKKLYLSAKEKDFPAIFVAAIFGIGFLLLGIGNLGTALHPIPAFDGFLSGFAG